MSIMDILSVTVFVGLLALTACQNLFTNGALKFGGRILYSLIPSWSFFAPTPGTQNFHLLFRDMIAGSKEMGPWREIEDVQMSKRRPLHTAIWNPQKRRKKAIFDLVSLLIITAQRPNMTPEEVQFSTPYLYFLSYVCNQPRSNLAEMRQFALLVSEPDKEPQVVFLSAMHRME
jgi:hypothetical protein